jgi:hypothetical protein
MLTQFSLVQSIILEMLSSRLIGTRLISEILLPLNYLSHLSVKTRIIKNRMLSTYQVYKSSSTEMRYGFSNNMQQLTLLKILQLAVFKIVIKIAS